MSTPTTKTLQSQRNYPQKTRKRAKSLRTSLFTFSGPTISIHSPIKDDDATSGNNTASSLNNSEDDDRLSPPLMMRDNSNRKYSGASASGSSIHISRSFRRTTSSRNVDHSHTVWWGWVILITTWVVFVVGMGSVLGIWDWAWYGSSSLVSQTTKEDYDSDEDLPIPGYYPALLILTFVVAWVWVVIAWVGMKYFKHARIAPSNEREKG